MSRLADRCASPNDISHYWSRRTHTRHKPSEPSAPARERERENGGGGGGGERHRFCQNRYNASLSLSLSLCVSVVRLGEHEASRRRSTPALARRQHPLARRHLHSPLNSKAAPRKMKILHFGPSCHRVAGAVTSGVAAGVEGPADGWMDGENPKEAVTGR
jgi:hypothetical protein